MGLISTWTCFWLWLLLELWIIGEVSSLECYSCSKDDCHEVKAPYNTVVCEKDPNVVCLLVSLGYSVQSRQCATREFVGKMGGATDFCKDANYDQMKGADDWIQNTTDAGYRVPVDLARGSYYTVCACQGPDKCNEMRKGDGDKYGGKGTGVTVHSLSNFAFGIVILMSGSAGLFW